MINNTTTVPGLYIHIPFCKSKCEYCDFYSATDTGFIPLFVDAILKEIDAYREEFMVFDTIYLGGGTPSLLSLQQIETILNKIRNTFTLEPDPEITVEVNPADWRREDLRIVRSFGINRVSIGVQSLDDRELLFLGRRHNGKQAMLTVEDSISAGFKNISMDMIYGLPGQSFQRWHDSLLKALTFNPTHLSCYELEVKSSTPLGLRYDSGEFLLQTEDRQRDFFIRTSESLEKAGYIHYEISNFAQSMDKASRHNQKYWDHTPYLGLGPSAHSFNHGRRWWNHASLGDYLRELEDKEKPIKDSEKLDNEQLRMETIMLGLRTRKGIDLGQYERRYGRNLVEENGLLLKELNMNGLIEIKEGFIRPTVAGMAIADSLALL
jgi:oxygen-independent coproporphyrinogen-3 oxidase